MKPDLKVSTVEGGLVSLTTPAAGKPDVRLAVLLDPVDAAALGTTLIKHAVTALQSKTEGKR